MPGGKRPKVWHIYEFERRFELKEDVRACRKGPLLYCKEAVSNNDDNAKDYCLQLTALRRYDNHLELHGAFVALRNQAADRSRAYRGYLLNGKRAPAQTVDICDWLGVKTPEARKILKRLEAVGLIEHITLPEFDLSKNEEPEKKASKSGSPEKSGEIQSPSRRKGKGNGKCKETARVTANVNGSKPEEKTNGKASQSNAEAKGKPQGQAEAKGQTEAKGQAEAKGKPQGPAQGHRGTALPPTTTPPLSPTPTSTPIMPTEADARGPVGAAAPKAPWRSDMETDLTRIGQVLTGTPPDDDDEQHYSEQAKLFGATIYTSLGLGYGRVQEARELGTFKSCWKKAEEANLPPPVATELWDQAIAKAMKLRKKRSAKKPGAVFCNIWGGLFARAVAGSL